MSASVSGSWICGCAVGVLLLASCVLAQPTIQGSGLFIVGQRKSLACTVTTAEVTSSFPLYWTSDKSVGVLPPESQQTIPVSTTITSFNTYYTFDVAATNNREVFTCTSNLNSGGAATWTIYVYQPPQTPVITGPSVVQSGAESVWTCVVDGASSSSPSVDWNFGNGTRVSSSLYANDPLVYTDANALEIHKVTSTLTLTPPVSQPNFDLFCVAAHFDTSTEKRGQVSVTVQYPPVIGGGALNITVTTGIDYKIDCQISASPAFTAVTWYKDGVALTPGGRYVGGTVASPDLIINGWTKTDAGGYVCRVSNSVGTTDGPLNTFTVRYLPIISYPQNPVGGVVNSDLALPCLIDAVPAHTTVRWYSVNSVSGLETEILPNNNPTKYSGGNALTPALTVLDLATSDAGLYLCKADNNVGRGTGTTLMVQVTSLRVSTLFHNIPFISFSRARVTNGTNSEDPPTINVTNTTYDVNLGSSVTIPCDYDAFPSATSVSWTKNSVPLSLPSADGRLTGGSIATPGLTIANLQVLDTAVFRCEVVSPLGSATSPNISLGVVYAPVVSTPVTSYNGSLGSDVTLACSAVAYPPVFLVLWYKDGQVLNLELPYAGKYSVVSRNSPSLTIYNSTAGDSGNYTCHARNQEGRVDSDVISFDVIYAPIMTADTTSYTGNVSQPVTLSCLYDAFPPVTSVVWTKGSQTIDVTSSGGRYTGSTLVTPSLTINNVTEGDAGSYTCNAVNSIGTGRSNAIALAVNYPPRVTTDRTFLRTSETQSAVLTCSYQAAPAPTTLQWLRNGDVIDTADVTKYSGGTVASPILVIQNLQKSDIGNYTCRAVNELGTGDSGKLLLDVLYAPKMSVNTTRYETEAGGTVTFSCWYDSNPAPTGIQWTKNSQVVDVVNSGGKYSGATLAIPGLTVASLTTTDAGVYVCSVTNSLGPGFTPDVALVVNYLPNFNVTTPTDVISTKGVTVTVPCPVSANPAPTSVTWYKDGVEVVVVAGGRYSGGTVSSPDLTITGAGGADSGGYVCRVTNALGTANSTQTNVDVQYPPEILSSGSSGINATEGTSTTVPCTYDANPLPSQITWTKDGVLVDVTSGRYTGGSVGSPGLTLTVVNTNDTGEYACRVVNSRGAVDSPPVNLTVQHAPKLDTHGLSEVNVSKGGTVILPCSVTAVPFVTSLQWLRNGVAIDVSSPQYSGGNLFSPALIINSVNESLSGQYRCLATNAVGTSQSQIISVNVVYEPSLSVGSTSYALNVLQPTQSVTMTCSYDANPPPTAVTWTKDSERVGVGSSGGKYSGSSLTEPSLTINRLTGADSGVYVCSAQNAIGNGSSDPVTLTVNYPPTFNVTTPTDVISTKGVTVTVPCPVSANPAPTSVTWYKDGVEVVVVAGGRYSGGTVSSPDLTITGAGGADSGGYVCRVTNALGTANSTGTDVSVEYPPEIVSNQTEVAGGEATPLFIPCTYDASPPPSQVTWTKDGVLLNVTSGRYTGGSVGSLGLTVVDARPSDAGVYACRVVNSKGTVGSGDIPVVVTYKPKIDTGPTGDLNGTQGQPVTLQCDVSAAPEVTSLTWLRDGGVLDLRDSLKYRGGTPATPSLTLLALDSADAGVYACRAVNAIGTTQSGNLTLDVNYKPTITVGGPVSGVEGQPSTIACNVDALPAVTSLTWYKGGQLLDTSNGTRYSGGTTSTPSLTIRTVQAEDAGSYYCVASNSVGSTTGATTTVAVTYTPKIDVGSTQIGGDAGGSVTLPITLRANPPVTELLWRKLDDVTAVPVTLDLTTGKYGGGTLTSPTLVITALSTSDVGTYIATAKNTQGLTTSQQITVAVSYAPSTPVVTGNVDFKETEPITLTCSSDGFPAPQFRWYRGSSTPLTTGPTLTIASAAPSDNGQVRCEAYNAKGQAHTDVTLNVQYKPRAASSLSNVTSDLDDAPTTATLTCATDANPPASTYMWYRNGAQMAGTDTASSLLSVTVTNSSQLGPYSCTATNAQGTSDPITVFITDSSQAGTGGTRTGQSTEDSGGLSTATLVLIIIVCLILLIVLILLLIYCCTSKRCFKKDNDVRPQPVPPPVLIPHYAKPLEAKLNGHVASAYAGNDRIKLDESPVKKPEPNGVAPVGHGLIISVPGGGTPRPHHLPPLGEDGLAQEKESAREEKPKKKKKKHRRRHRDEEEGGSPRRSHHHDNNDGEHIYDNPQV